MMPIDFRGAFRVLVVFGIFIGMALAGLIVVGVEFLSHHISWR